MGDDLQKFYDCSISCSLALVYEPIYHFTMACRAFLYTAVPFPLIRYIRWRAIAQANIPSYSIIHSGLPLHVLVLHSRVQLLRVQLAPLHRSPA